jgi:hypothetical protein
MGKSNIHRKQKELGRDGVSKQHVHRRAQRYMAGVDGMTNCVRVAFNVGMPK